jgi:hypothetical protein
VNETDGLPLFAHEPTTGHRKAAEEWMREHPEAMGLFHNLARQAASRGRKFGVKLLAERVRWEFSIARNDEEFKINNNHTAYIARALVASNPSLRGLLEFRRTISEDNP